MIRQFATLLAAVALAAWLTAPAQAARVSAYREFDVVKAFRSHHTIRDATVGADGALWMVTGRPGRDLIRFDRRDRITPFSLEAVLGPRSGLIGIERGRAGNLWVHGYGTPGVGGAAAEYLLDVGLDGRVTRTLPLPAHHYTALTMGSEGDLWLPYGKDFLTESGVVTTVPGIVRYHPGGGFTEYPTPAVSLPVNSLVPLGGAMVFEQENFAGERFTELWRFAPGEEPSRMAHLRESMIGLGRAGRGRVWMGLQDFGTVEGRVLSYGSGPVRRIRGLDGLVTDVAPGARGATWALEFACKPFRFERPRPRPRDCPTRKYESSIYRRTLSGRLVRYRLPKALRMPVRFFFGPRGRVWILLGRDPFSDDQVRLARLTLHPPP